MGHLHGGRILITVQCDDFYAVTLQFNGNFFAQFSRAAQQSLLGNFGERSTDFYHNDFVICV